MSQPQIKGTQLDPASLTTAVDTSLSSIFDGNVLISGPVFGETLLFIGSPVGWRNSIGVGGIVAGDGLNSAGGSPVSLGSPITQVLSVDTTVARLNVTLNTFAFAGDVSLNLDDTTQGADARIWRISNTGSQLIVSTRTDIDGAGNNAITIARSGTTVSNITLPSPLIITASGEGTSSAIQLNSNDPRIVFNDTDATATSTIWDMGTTQGSPPGVFEFRTRTDAHGAGATWLSVKRSGTTVTSIDFVGNAMTINGLQIVAGSPVAGGGGGGDVTKVGNPSDNEVGIWTGDGTIEGDANLTWSGSVLQATGNIQTANVDGPVLIDVGSGVRLAPNRGSLTTGISGGDNSMAIVNVGTTAVSWTRVVGSTTGIQAKHNVDPNLTASTSHGSGFLLCRSSYNRITTVNNPDDSITAYTATAGANLFVLNEGANRLELWPSGSGDLGAGVNNPVKIEAGGWKQYTSFATFIWTLIGSSTFLDPTFTGGSPLTATIGDTLFYDGTNWVNLARGTAGQVLTMGSPLVPSWQNIVGGSPLVSPDPLLLSDGTNTDPTYSFAGDTGTGIYTNVASVLEIALGGVRSWTFQGDRFHSQTGNGPIIIAEAATGTNPTLIPRTGNDGTGIGAADTTTLSLIANSIECMRFDEASSIVTNETFGRIIGPAGSVTLPTYGFTSDLDTGLYSAGADQISLATGGVEAMRLSLVGSPRHVLQAVEANVGLSVVGSPPAQGDNVITSTYNVYDTVATAGDAVTLPATFIVGTKVWIKNDGGASMDVFPASGDNLGAGVDTQVALADGSAALFLGTVVNSTWTQLI